MNTTKHIAMKNILLAATLFSILFFGAATATRAATEPKMRIALVRTGEGACLPVCVEWISMEGEFDSATPAQFRAIVKRIGARRPPVLISSPGGDISAAESVGRMIRKLGLDVAVSKTQLQIVSAKQEADGRGEPRSFGAMCNSACTFLLAAGKRRVAPRNVVVGVHEAVIPDHDAQQHIRYYQTRQLKRGDKIISSETRFVAERVIKQHITRRPPGAAAYKAFGRYFDEMGVSGTRIIDLMHTAAPEKITVLNDILLATSKLVTERTPIDAFLGLAPAPSAWRTEPALPAAVAATGRWKIDQLARLRDTPPPRDDPKHEETQRVEEEEPPHPRSLLVVALALGACGLAVARLSKRRTPARNPTEPPLP